MEVLVTGGDTELGRTIAEGFRDAGHCVVITGARRDELEVAAKELEVDAVVCDSTDPASLVEAHGLFPHHLDTIVNVPAPRWQDGDPRNYSLEQHRNALRNALESVVLAPVLMLQTVGDHLRSGGSIVSVITEGEGNSPVQAAVKAALSEWTAVQAPVFGARGITMNVVAAGRGALPAYDGLNSTSSTSAVEYARLAVFLATRGARHITGQTLHVSSGRLLRFA